MSGNRPKLSIPWRIVKDVNAAIPDVHIFLAYIVYTPEDICALWPELVDSPIVALSGQSSVDGIFGTNR